MARAASLQATSSQHPSKVSPDRGLHPRVAEFLVMSRKFCGISFGFRIESSGVWRCAGCRAAVWWLRSSDGRRSRRTRPDSRHCEVSPPLTLSPSRTADNPTETRLRLPQHPARSFPGLQTGRGQRVFWSLNRGPGLLGKVLYFCTGQ